VSLGVCYLEPKEVFMHYGVVMFPTEYAMAPDELARALEERGFESVWFPEHTHIPASRQSPWPGGGELPREYWSSYDPFVALMAAAGATKRLKLGTGICLVIERDPITLAKEVATLDRLSDGRVLFGIGGGWNREEMANHQTEWKGRWRLLRERVLAMKEIWTKREAEFHGEFVNFDKIWADPKPIQKPHPPIIIGGDGATTFDRVVEFGDGWMPIMRPHTSPVEKIPALRERLKKAGRDPKSAPVSIFFAPPKRPALDALEAAGVERAIFGVPSEPRDAILKRLDGFTAAMRG
jgi:probable F420-dependent oxidoreductase